MIGFVSSGLKSLRTESSAEINVRGSTSVAAVGAGAEAALGTAVDVEMQELLLASVLPALSLVSWLRKNCIYLSTTLSSSLTAAV